MAEVTFLEALRQGIWEEMERDERVFILGEDVGAYGGAFKVTDGFSKRFGASRVIDTPISEAAIVGAAAGAAHMGLRPVAEMQFIDFISCAYDMLTNDGALSGRPLDADGGARSLRRLRARRTISLAEPRGGVPAHAGTQDRLSGDGAGRERSDQILDPR